MSASVLTFFVLYSEHNQLTSLLQLSKSIDNINEWIGSKASWITVVLVLIMCIDVFNRKVLNFSENWILELEWYLFGILFLLGFAYTWKDDKHVRVDLFYDNYSDRRKGLINFLGTLIFVIPWCLVVIKTSWDYGMNSWSFREGSPNHNGLPARYLIKFMITIGFTLLLLQAISILIKSYLQMKGDLKTELE